MNKLLIHLHKELNRQLEKLYEEELNKLPEWMTYTIVDMGDLMLTHNDLEYYKAITNILCSKTTDEILTILQEKE